MNWRCGSRRRVLALQGQNPEFKPHSHKKQKKDFVQNLQTTYNSCVCTYENRKMKSDKIVLRRGRREEGEQWRG
jgi:hypothetical protein